MQMDAQINVARLREVFHYDPKTGVLSRLSPRPKETPGAQVGHLSRSGYIVVGIDRRVCRAHRVCWALHTGAWPLYEIDHRNGVRSDNRWVNLRDVKRHVNMHNKPRSNVSASGYQGVYPLPSGGFMSTFSFDKKRHYVGVFRTAEAAYDAYLRRWAAVVGELAPRAE